MQRALRGWGVSARLAASGSELLQSALAGLPAGFRTSRSEGRGPWFRCRKKGTRLELLIGPEVRFAGRSTIAFQIAVADALETFASTHSERFAFLHAGGVAIDGRAILLPGRSHAGKSTLVAAFLKRGAAYLSDDMVPIDWRLHAHPFPRPLGIRSLAGGMPKRTPVASLGALSADRSLPIALVWCGSYDPLATRPAFKRRQGGEAFAELLAHAPGARIRPGVIVPILAKIAASVPVFRGVRGDADAMIDEILRRL